MRRFVFLIPEKTSEPRGGIMNIVRHALVARAQGGETVLATDSGRDPHGRRWFRHDLECIRWADRGPEDACLVPDLYSARADSVRGTCIVYLQTPLRLERDFDWRRPAVELWTDSPFMVGRCRERYPGKDIRMVPNVVDDGAFPWVEPSRRRSGMLIVFPRKGADFVEASLAAYRAAGGRYWKPRAVHGVPFPKLAAIFGEAQAFLASGDVEGCALPPQEAMAAGVVVVGRDAGGANFCMKHRETALVARTPQETAAALRELEDPALRETLARRAHREISRFFPGGEPAALWRDVLGAMEPARS